MAKEIFSGATAILPICKHLEKITNKHLPDKTSTYLMRGLIHYIGIM
jgi:hypothetical protein